MVRCIHLCRRLRGRLWPHVPIVTDTAPESARGCRTDRAQEPSPIVRFVEKPSLLGALAVR